MSVRLLYQDEPFSSQRVVSVLFHGGGERPYTSDHPLAIFLHQELKCSHIYSCTLPLHGIEIHASENAFIDTFNSLPDRPPLPSPFNSPKIDERWRSAIVYFVEIVYNILQPLFSQHANERILLIGFSLGALTACNLYTRLALLLPRKTKQLSLICIGAGLTIPPEKGILVQQFWHLDSFANRLKRYRKIHAAEKIPSQLKLVEYFSKV